MPLFLATYRPALAGRSLEGTSSRELPGGSSRSRQLCDRAVLAHRDLPRHAPAAASPLSASPSTAPHASQRYHGCPVRGAYRRHASTSQYRRLSTLRTITAYALPGHGICRWRCRWPSFCIAWTATRSLLTRPRPLPTRWARRSPFAHSKRRASLWTYSPPTCLIDHFGQS